MLHTTVFSKPRKFSTILFRVAQVPVTAGNVRRFLPEATGTAEPTPSQFSSLKNDRRPGSGGADWPVTRRAVFRRGELLIPHISARLRFELPPRAGLRSGQRSCAPAPRRRAALSEVRNGPAGPALPVTVACPPGRSGRAHGPSRAGLRPRPGRPEWRNPGAACSGRGLPPSPWAEPASGRPGRSSRAAGAGRACSSHPAGLETQGHS
jgi:hypothetical protein